MSRSALLGVVQLAAAIAVVAGLGLALGWAGVLAGVGAIVLTASLILDDPDHR